MFPSKKLSAKKLWKYQKIVLNVHQILLFTGEKQKQMKVMMYGGIKLERRLLLGDQ